jgi:hypothetical protein
MKTEPQQYNCFIRNGGNSIPKFTYPDGKSTLLWVLVTHLGGSSNCWQVSKEEAERVIPKRQLGSDKDSVKNIGYLHEEL